MAESVYIPADIKNKKEKYDLLLPQIKALVEGEHDLIANVANMMAALKLGMNFFWVGVYFVKGDQLVLGPFQGPVACLRINYGKGVCGTSWKESRTIIVPDVDEFPGHIACSIDSKSEIVIPVFKNGNVQAVLDVDSNVIAGFDETDAHYLGQVSTLIATFL
jgi:L-methionine (R)-S-oxide reductase